VEDRLHRAVFVSPTEADLKVSVSLGQGSDAQWSAHVTMRDADGHRLGDRLVKATGASCAALDDALVLVVALMLDMTREEAVRRPPEADQTAAAQLKHPVAGRGTSPAQGSDASSRPSRVDKALAVPAWARTTSAGDPGTGRCLA